MEIIRQLKIVNAQLVQQIDVGFALHEARLAQRAERDIQHTAVIEQRITALSQQQQATLNVARVANDELRVENQENRISLDRAHTKIGELEAKGNYLANQLYYARARLNQLQDDVNNQSDSCSLM